MYGRLAVHLAAAALLGAVAAVPYTAIAACPAPTAMSQGSSAPPTAAKSTVAAPAPVVIARNGAGQPVDQAGIPLPGTALGAAADDRDWQKPRATAQTAPSNTACN